MRRLPIVLLPGMDGTGHLFAAFVKAAPPEFEPVVVSLPPSGSYDHLSAVVSEQLPKHDRFLVLAESFSGPIALRVARRASDQLMGVVLCNSFILPPWGRAWKMLPWSLMFSLRGSSALIRNLFVGREASAEIIAAVRAAVAKTPRQVLASRIRLIHSLNDAELLNELSVPILYLRGTDDWLVPVSASATIQRIAPRVRLESIPGPHLLLQVKPDEAWAAIQQFARAV